MRRPLAVLLLALGAAATAIAPGGGAATLVHADDDGLDITSTVVYTLIPEQGLVRVVADATFTNSLPDTSSGGQVTSYFFDSFSWPMPAGARNVVARSGDEILDTITIDVPEADDYFFIDVIFDRDLQYLETTQVTLEYDLVGLPPRSPGYDRINPAYAGFDAYGAGDPGRMDVRFDFPAGWEAEIVGGRYSAATTDGRVVYRMTTFDDERYGYAVFVSARRDDALASTDVTTLDGRNVEILSWPGDDEWSAFIAEEIATGLPVLAELIGQPWPEGDDFVIREAYTPYLYGYAGWYSADDSEIEIGEALDSETVLHELSHAWFNERWFLDRWASEGFAQEYSNRTLEERGDEWFAPEEVSPDDPVAVTLQEWGDPDFVEGADESEAYGYAASYYVVDAIVSRLDDDTMRRVFAAVDARSYAYVGDLPAETYDTAADWRRLLDLLEEVAGSRNATSVFTDYVLTPEQAAELPTRSAARERYHELDERGDAWAPPVVVRTAMGDWSWTDVESTIGLANAVLDVRDELDTKARALGLDYPDSLEAAYEAADDTQPDAPTGLGTVTTSLQAQVQSADALLGAIAAEAQSDGLLGWIGLLGTDLAGDLDSAREAFTAGDLETVTRLSADVVAAVDDASEDGNVRVLVALGVILVIVGIAASAVRRRRTRERRRADAVMVPLAAHGAGSATAMPPAPAQFAPPPPSRAGTAETWRQAASSSSSAGRVEGVAEPPAGSDTNVEGTS